MVSSTVVRRLVAGSLWALVLAGCARSVPAPARPTPASVTREEPGGDAEEPETAALRRLVEEPVSTRVDRRSVVLIALPDGQVWRRVRPRLADPLTAFRYGDEHHAVVAVFVRELDHPDPTEAECLADFEGWAEPRVRVANVDLGAPSSTTVTWRGRPLEVRLRDVTAQATFRGSSWMGAYAAYAPYKGRGTCLVLLAGVSRLKSPEIAAAARRRLVETTFARLLPTGRPP